ncbi:unnamed protein product, partial [Adineta ricciae]
IILELMITYYQQLFVYSTQQEQINKSTLKSQPDLIPMEFHSKNRSNSNENLLENSILSVQPSPGTRRKNKAPPPPPSSSAQQIYQEETYSEQIINPNPSVVSSSSFTSNDKVHRRTPSDGIQLDRPNAPPPLPPPVVVVASPVIRSKERLSIPLQTSSNYSTNEQTTCNEDKSNENDTVNVGKLISELNNRMAAAKLNNNNNTQTNNIRVSSIRNSTLNSPGETTDF